MLPQARAARCCLLSAAPLHKKLAWGGVVQVNVGSSFYCVESIANITEIHEELNLDQGQGGRHFDSSYR